MKARSLLVVTSVGMLTLGMALPASAAEGDTPIALTVLTGSLSISVPAGAADLGSRVNTLPGGTISGPLGSVQVLDARNAAAGTGWVASVISTALTPVAPAVGPTLAASLVGYTAGSITKVGTATFTANNPAVLTGASAAVTATAITGDNSATWTPTINVAVPGGTVSGVYTGTITHSVL